MKQVLLPSTTNLPFTKWKEVLNNDEALTDAILDRLIHHSHIINIQGDSNKSERQEFFNTRCNFSS